MNQQYRYKSQCDSRELGRKIADDVARALAGRDLIDRNNIGLARNIIEREADTLLRRRESCS